MKQLKLNIQTRDTSGTAASKRLRSTGRVPAVIYGESGSRLLTVGEIELRDLLKKTQGSTALLELGEDGVEEAHYAILKDIQRDTISGNFLHVDLQEIVRGKPMTADVALHLVGDCAGVKLGGVLDQQVHEVTVRCRPRYLPEFVEADVSALAVGERLHVSDIKTTEEVEVLSDASLVVASVVGAGAPVEEAEEEADA